MLVDCFITKKMSFFLTVFTFGKKIVDQRSGANLKKRVFGKILLQISCFFSFFAQKMLKMTISTLHLECAAPKSWSKYTTDSYIRSYSSDGKAEDCYPSKYTTAVHCLLYKLDMVKYNSKIFVTIILSQESQKNLAY